jgi:hypothetical protein
VKRVEGAFACGIGRCDEFRLVGTCELAIVVEGVLEDVDDCLLKRYDLGLQLVLCDC